jgi:hypothetical protein
MASVLRCLRCKLKVPARTFNTGALASCPSCHLETQVEVFEAYFTGPAAASRGEAVLAEGESSCFNHPTLKAVSACGGCGRFLCGLCQVEWRGRQLCPDCLAAGKEKGKLGELETRRPLYDGIALTLAVLPVLIWPFTCVTAPAALFVGVWSFWTPGSIVPRSRYRAVLAIIIAGVQIALWMAWFLGGLRGLRF